MKVRKMVSILLMTRVLLILTIGCGSKDVSSSNTISSKNDTMTLNTTIGSTEAKTEVKTTTSKPKHIYINPNKTLSGNKLATAEMSYDNSKKGVIMTYEEPGMDLSKFKAEYNELTNSYKLTDGTSTFCKSWCSDNATSSNYSYVGYSIKTPYLEVDVADIQRESDKNLNGAFIYGDLIKQDGNYYVYYNKLDSITPYRVYWKISNEVGDSYAWGYVVKFALYNIKDKNEALTQFEKIKTSFKIYLQGAVDSTDYNNFSNITGILGDITPYVFHEDAVDQLIK